MQKAQIKVGDKLRDNDPRCEDRPMLTVTRTDHPEYVFAKNSIGNEFRYSRKRIFTDGKARRSGLSLVRFEVASS